MIVTLPVLTLHRVPSCCTVGRFISRRLGVAGALFQLPSHSAPNLFYEAEALPILAGKASYYNILYIIYIIFAIIFTNYIISILLKYIWYC